MILPLIFSDKITSIGLTWTFPFMVIVAILGGGIFLFFSTKYLLSPIFVLVENTEAGFAKISKASKKTLEDSCLTIMAVIVVMVLIIGTIQTLLGFVVVLLKHAPIEEGPLKVIRLINSDSVHTAIALLSYFVMSFRDLIISFFNCSIMASIYLHFRPKMIAAVQVLQQENNVVSKG